MSLLGLVIYLIILWLLFPLFKCFDNFLSWILRWKRNKERNKRIDFIFQTYQDEIEAVYRKDPDVFKKMFAGIEQVKNLPSDIFKR